MRITVTYTLLAVLFISLAGLFAWALYHSRERSIRRAARRERDAYEAARQKGRLPYEGEEDAYEKWLKELGGRDT